MFTRVRRYGSNLNSIPVILKNCNGMIFACEILRGLEESIIITNIHQYSESEREWAKYTLNPEAKEDIQEEIPFRDIMHIYQCANKDADLETIMMLWEHPKFSNPKPPVCTWVSDREPHSIDCDTRLHEAMANLYTIARKAIQTEDKGNEFRKEFSTIIRWINRHGGNIPPS